MKMLMFDFRETERDFFNRNNLQDIEITFLKESLNENTKLNKQLLNETDVISVFTTSILSEKVLSQFPNLRIVSTRSTGYNHIDLQYCSQNNIAVINVSEYGKTAVAQFAIGIIIALIRNLLPAANDMKKCNINLADYEGRTLNDMTIGIIGAGAIGSTVAKIAHFFGMRVIIYSYMKNQDIIDICEYVSLEALLEQSDIISLHVPYTGDNYHMLGKKEFDKMKHGAYVINTARGELIDLQALYDSLISGKIKGVGLDVMECEFTYSCKEKFAAAQTNVTDCFTVSEIAEKLFALPNVIITPHIAYNTRESINYILEKTFNSIKDFTKGLYTNRVL